ncbi:acyl-CoA thioesterase [Haliangium sp.]|uniref:acyl-CoA thioesterase n=1 Tax=Haliangium sp. TaxID=2663208 RepID=UPI003D0B81DE
MAESEQAAYGDLAADTAVKPLLSTPGLYTVDLPDRWNFAGPSGGVLMSAALRAMRAQLDDTGLRVLSVNAVFCAPVSSGPLVIRVEILRSGGSAAQVRAQLTSTSRPGPGVELLATFARTRSGLELHGARFPDVRGVEEAEDITKALREPMGPFRSMRFFHNFEARLAAGRKWWDAEGEPPAEPRCARWFRYLVAQRDARKAFDRVAIPPIVDTMPPAVWQALEPGQPALYAPGLDLTVHFLDDTRSEWLLASAYARRAHAGYASAEVEIWSDDRKLVAYGTQTMTFRPIPRRSTAPTS